MNFPNALAMAMNFEKGEIVEWEIESIDCLIMKRKEPTKKRKEKN